MCGIAGIYQPSCQHPDPKLIRNMLSQIQYRGPDEAGIYIGSGLGMGSVRLSIIDIVQGQQPMSTLDKELWIVFNGEIFNYLELRKELIDLGYEIRTNSDTEVLLLLFRHYREDCLERINGQFAFAIWDSKREEVFLARDRVGIRPLFYCFNNGTIVFASEIKCLMESGFIQPEIDPKSLNQVFTFWTIPSPGTIFKNIFELPPGHYMTIRKNSQVIRSYWNLEFKGDSNTKTQKNLQDSIEEFESLINDSVKLRLRSDVPVAAYLSGGIDSSATTSIIKQLEPGILNTFSIGFDQYEFDETEYQKTVSEWFDTDHNSIICASQDIATNFAQVVWHTEIPILRTGAIPMFLLSKLVHDNGIKVVITGEGADEFLGGYNIFKESLIREFWSKQPESKIRPLLLQRLYPYLTQFQGRSNNLLKLFFGFQLTETNSPIYSHLIRWNNSKHIREHFSVGLIDASEIDPIEGLLETLPIDFENLDILSRAQWIESKLFLSGYLLSSQGDRMSMAHSVEGRYPFLDHRVIEFCTKLPANQKIKGLNEKYLLKQLMKDRLPNKIVNRSKQAYRAPVATSLISKNSPEYLRDIMSPDTIGKYGLFNPGSVQKLLTKIRSGKTVTENDNMAVAGILSTQIIYDLFVNGNNPYRENEMRIKCPVHYDIK